LKAVQVLNIIMMTLTARFDLLLIVLSILLILFYFVFLELRIR
jgi:hypothetical protein